MPFFKIIFISMPLVSEISSLFDDVEGSKILYCPIWISVALTPFCMYVKVLYPVVKEHFGHPSFDIP